MTTNLSVIIIAKDAAATIKQCLDSVSFADEIIVLDSGSTDKTVDICKQYTDKIYVTDWPGFGAQKNRALDKVSHEWVLSIDADEYLSPELRNNIQQVIQNQSDDVAYSMLRRTSLCGKYIKHGDWGNDYCVRLFKANKARFTDVAIHEYLKVEGKVGKVGGLLMHDSYPDIHSLVDRMNRYTSMNAKILREKGKTSSIYKALLRAMWRFIRAYFIRLGFLDGREGFLVAVITAESAFYRYAKLAYKN